MPKINVWALTPPASKTLTKTIKDPKKDGVEVTLSLRSLNTPEQMAWQEEAARLTRKHITGDPDYDNVPVDFPAVGGQIVKVSEPLFRHAAMLEAMQDAQPGESYTAEEFCALAAGMSPEGWAQVIRFVNEVSGADSPN